MNGGEIAKRELFEQWFDRYGAPLLLAARRVVGAQQAEDVVHDVFVRLWEHMAAVPPEAVGAWLFRAVRNRALDTLAHRRVRLLWSQKASSSQEVIAEQETPIPDLLEGALELLSGRQREVLLLNKIEGVPLGEVARQLGISARTAEKHLQLAARQLRKIIT